ncbi:Dps family protein [Rubritalea marina]|uniref:Dps family protein n=1 Tax=Rubritalea marina TaxID=361055 RepID=UPI00037A7FA4|nr:DNA starvation/stationary phase protection protein [Rubritalea marina]
MSNQSDQVVAALRQVVADTYALMGQTHLCHWNVRGPGFFALHAAFEEQYTELFTAVDEIAERVRALGALAPGGLGNLAQSSSITELEEDADADAMVAHLASANLVVVESLAAARDAAAAADDSESEDLAIARIQVHQKTIWMLKSYLGQ